MKEDRKTSLSDDNISPGIVTGRNAVRELIKSGGEIEKILVSSREGSVSVIIAEARKKNIPVINADSQKLDHLSGGIPHQGIAAFVSAKEYVSVDDILLFAEKKGEKPFILIADGIEDPHNLGAIIRCAECSGVHGVIIPKRHSVGITQTVVKASAGAIWHMNVARVTNIARTVDYLKEKGVWIFSAEAGGQPFNEVDFDTSCAVVFGSEGFGVSRLVKDKSDYIVSIPMYGKVNSLNVSTAASVILCDAAMKKHKTSL